MKAAILTTTGFDLREIPTPVVDENTLLIKTLACGVCSGDLFVYQNRAQLPAGQSQLGHEPTGRIMAVGDNVTGFRPGEIVTALAWPGYAEYFTAAAHDLVRLPASIDPVFALGEAVACCVHAANRFGIQPGDKVAMIGLGFMGLVCQQLAAYQDAGLIIGVDPLPDRRVQSARFGANATYDPGQINAAEMVRSHGYFDVVIEATGAQSAIDYSTRIIAQHGRLILVGYHQSNEGLRTIDMQQWNYKAIDVINGHVRRHDEKLEAMRQGMDLMSKGVIDTRPLVTPFALDDTEQAFQELDQRRPGLFKAVLIP